jgi:hypothetical protein
MEEGPQGASTSSGGAPAPDSSAELAKKLNNPIASLISVPIQNNWDFGIGAADAMRYTLNVQPVIPFSLSEDWTLITRTIVPYIYAQSPTIGGSSTSGVGDILQSFFLSPKDPVDGGVIGAGPVFSYPSASNDALGSGKWGVGPTFVVLKQESGFTYGMLANQVWSFAGDDARPDVSQAFVQPFFAYTTKSYTTFTINTESSYDWETSEWTVPLNLMVTQLLKIGGHPIAFQIGVRDYVDAPPGGPEWGLRFTITPLFPN